MSSKHDDLQASTPEDPGNFVIFKGWDGYSIDCSPSLGKGQATGRVDVPVDAIATSFGYVDVALLHRSLPSSLVPHARLFSLHPSLVSQNSSLSHGLGAMNSCGSMHGLCMHDNSLVVHENSWGALGHKNSCFSHAAGVRGGTEAPSTSTRIRSRRSAVEKLASPQQTSSKLHVDVWEGLLSNQGMRFSQEEEIVPGCAVTVARPSCLDDSPEPPGPGRIIRNMFGWSQLEKTVRSGVRLFRGALRGENLFSSLCAAGDWVKKGSYHTAWSVPCDSSCTCSYAYGRGSAVGPHTGRRCWPLLAGVWRAIAPLMKPWCAEGEVPTAANLNLYRGWKSCVCWHCDDEPLFGKCGDANLIVSVSFGSSVPFRWRRQSCSDGEGHLCRLGHGDILVMDGQCQDEFFHCTSSGRDLERINVTFRWIKQHAFSCPFLKAGVACCLPTCEGSSVPVMGNAVNGFLVSSWCFVHVESSSLAGLPVVYKAWVTLVCLLLDTPFRRRSVEALPL